MKSSAIRFAAAWLLGLGALFAATPAAAQGTGGTTGTLTSLTGDDFFVGVQGTLDQNLTDYDLVTYFNQANCQCQRKTWVLAALKSSSGIKRNYITRGNLELWVGVDCSNLTARSIAGQCQLLGGVPLTQFAASGGFTFVSDAQTLSRTRGAGITTDAGIDTGTDPCSPTLEVSTQSLWLLIDQDADNVFEAFAPKQIPVDLRPPPPVQPLAIKGGNEALVVNWTPANPTADASQILGYQIACLRANEFQVFKDGTFTPGFDTAATNCGNTALSPAILDPKFLCSDILAPSATSARIKILQNEIYYRMYLLTIDKHKNVSVSTFIEGKPEASLNFFNEYRNANPSRPGETPDSGKDPGGYCAVDPTTTSMRAGPLLGLAAAVAVALGVRRRRKQGRR